MTSRFWPVSASPSDDLPTGPRGAAAGSLLDHGARGKSGRTDDRVRMKNVLLVGAIAFAFSSAAIAGRMEQGGARPEHLGEIRCPAMPVVSPQRIRLIVEPAPHMAPIPPASVEDRKNYANWLKVDPVGLCRYREANRNLQTATAHRVVFIGDSITEAWLPSHPSLFMEDILNRGVSGQTTTQMLARFRTDVIDLHPAVVHIMAGINDIGAASGGELSRSNIVSMIELAQLHNIRVVIGSVTPSRSLTSSIITDPAGYIVLHNSWLREYARRHGLVYVDYYAALANDRQGIKDGLSNDGLHPNRHGYDVMTPLARKALAAALEAD